MRIAQVAPLAESVPPSKYGGTERVVSWLTEELVRRGHQVALFASGDSRTWARLEACAPRALRLAGVSDHMPFHLMMLGEVFARAGEFDVIHSHVDYAAFPFCRLSPTQVVHTLHGRLDLDHQLEIFSRQRGLCLVSISDAQRRPLPGIDFAATVYHGLPRELARFEPDPDDYLLFLGRISPEKGPVEAIEAASRAGARLVIAAKVDPVDKSYFESAVKPLLSRPRIDFIGEVSDREKPELLGKARALLAPIDWPEPFGLVFIESLSCGTPVITRPCGSVPEIVAHGVTGLVVSTQEELVRAIGEVSSLDRARCYAEFETRFTVERMVDDYEAVYRRAVAERGRAALEEDRVVA
jgi:glycosyltransferase involved in cell wall biosynthesis